MFTSDWLPVILTKLSLVSIDKLKLLKQIKSTSIGIIGTKSSQYTQRNLLVDIAPTRNSELNEFIYLRIILVKFTSMFTWIYQHSGTFNQNFL